MRRPAKRGPENTAQAKRARAAKLLGSASGLF